MGIYKYGFVQPSMPSKVHSISEKVSKHKKNEGRVLCRRYRKGHKLPYRKTVMFHCETVNEGTVSL